MRLTFDTMLPDAIQVADPFHLVKLANTRLDECRRRVQNETLGHRGHKDDPLYRCRRLLTKADERLDDNGRTKLVGLLDAGDPHGEVRMAWHAKEVVRSIYDHLDPGLALEFVTRLGHDLQDRVAFGFRRFTNYRIRGLLYAGRPNWDLLRTITPR